MYTLNGIPTTISLESGDGTFDPYFVLQTNVNGGQKDDLHVTVNLFQLIRTMKKSLLWKMVIE